MDVGAREQFDELVEDVLVELDHVVGDGQYLVEDAPSGPHRDLADLAEFGVGVDGGLGVAGHVDLRDHRDVPLGGVGDDLADVVLGEEAAVRAPVEHRWPARADLALGPPGALLGQLRVAADLDPPALVVGQVQVQHVELVHREEVDEPEDLALGLEVPGDVEHGPAPAETGGVGDTHGGQSPSAGGLAHGCVAVGVDGQELAQGLRSVEDTGGVVADDDGALGVHDQPVALLSQTGGGVHAQSDPRVLLVADAQGEPGRGAEFSPQPGQGRAGGLVRGDACVGVEYQALRTVGGDLNGTGEKGGGGVAGVVRHEALLLSGLDHYPTSCHGSSPSPKGSTSKGPANDAVATTPYRLLTRGDS